MNFKRVAMAAVAAWVVYLGVSYLVHGVLLRDIYMQYVGVMRPESQANAILPINFVVALLGFFAFAYAYAKGYEGGNGLQEGARYGVLIAIMLCAFALVWEYMVWPMGRRLYAAWLIDCVVEFTIYGMLVGFIYRPVVTAVRRPAV